jgi:hypothetical protein
MVSADAHEGPVDNHCAKPSRFLLFLIGCAPSIGAEMDRMYIRPPITLNPQSVWNFFIICEVN